MKWIKKWKVPSNSNPNKIYTVSQADDGTYGCSCPHWCFRRQECSHIAYIKITQPEPNSEPKKRPEIVPANVLKPTYNENENILMMPLIPLDPRSTHITATICFVALKYGYSITELRERYGLPQSWTKKAIIRYIEEHGECELPHYLGGRNRQIVSPDESR